MDFAVEIFEGLSAVTDGGMGERGEGAGRDFNGPGDEKLVVRRHSAGT